MKSDVYKAFISAPGTHTVNVEETSIVFHSNSASPIPNENAEGQGGIAACSNQGSDWWQNTDDTLNQITTVTIHFPPDSMLILMPRDGHLLNGVNGF